MKRPVRIAFVSQFNDFVGGGEHSLMDLLRNLSATWQPVLVTPDAGPLSRKAASAGIDVAYLPLPKLGLATLPALWQWLRWLRAVRPALIHANNSRAAIYAGITGRMLGVPMIFHCRMAEKDHRLDWVIARLATHIVANSQATARRFHPRFADKTEAIYNGIDLAGCTGEIEPVRPLDVAEGRIVLCVARVSRWKRHDLVLDAFEILASRLDDLHLVMLGGSDPYDPSWMEALKARTATLPCAERIHWLGHRDDVLHLYRIADVLVLASRVEPFGRVIVEAMASGVPVVAANAGGPAEIIQHGVSGMLVEGDAPEAWADALRMVLAKGGFRDGLIANGRRRAGDFSLQRHVQAMQDMFARQGGGRL